MLFRRDVLEGIAAGRVTLAFRSWDRPRAAPGALHRTPVGEVEIVAVDEVTDAAITEGDARAAGAASRDALLAELRRHRRAATYRIALRLAGPDRRDALRADAALDDAAAAAIAARLGRLDAASRRGPWTADVLSMVAARPATRAAELADELGVAAEVLKRDVRKLKELGLTESLGTGYRLSPRGAAYIARRR